MEIFLIQVIAFVLLRGTVECKLALLKSRECKSFCCTQCKNPRVCCIRALLNYDFLSHSKVSPSAAFPIYGGTFLARLCDSAHAFRAESASELSPWLACSSNVQSMSQLHFALIKRRSNLLITEEKTFSISERSQGAPSVC